MWMCLWIKYWIVFTDRNSGSKSFVCTSTCLNFPFCKVKLNLSLKDTMLIKRSNKNVWPDTHMCINLCSEQVWQMYFKCVNINILSRDCSWEHLIETGAKRAIKYVKIHSQYYKNSISLYTLAEVNGSTFICKSHTQFFPNTLCFTFPLTVIAVVPR